MRTKHCKLIYLVLSILVLILGMHVNTIETESTFTYASVEQPYSHILLHSIAIDDIELCTSVLGNSYHTIIQQPFCRYLKQKWEMKISLYFLCTANYILPDRKFFTSSELATFHNQNQDELVSRYIHKSDGKNEFNKSPIHLPIVI